MAKLEEFLKMRFPFHRPSCLEMLSLTRQRSTYFVSHANESAANAWPLVASATVYRTVKAAGGTSTTTVIWSIGAPAFPPEPSYLPELSAASFLNAHRRRLPPSLHIAAAAPWTCSCPHHRTSRPPPVAAAAPILDSLPCSVLLRSSQTRPHQESLELGMSNSKNSWIWTCPKYCLYQFLCVLEIIL
jgi:hypothetical protein